MSSQPNTPYLPIDTGEGHQDGQLVDHPGVYHDELSPTTPTPPEHPQDPPFIPDDINRDSLVEDGIVRPRFLGHAVGEFRGSLASSSGVPSFRENDNTSSLYALNPLGPNRDSSLAYSSVPYKDDPHDADFVPGGTVSPSRRGRYLEEKRDAYTAPSKSKRKIIIGAIVVGVIVIAIAVVVALFFTVIKKNANTSSGTGGSNGGNNNTDGNDGNNTTPSPNILKTGGDGSTITLENGTTITYSNKFGGLWYWDSEDPFNNNAQAQSWTPPLNQSFKWGQDRVFGSVPQSSSFGIPYSSFHYPSVNLGGWLVPEPVSFSTHLD